MSPRPLWLLVIAAVSFQLVSACAPRKAGTARRTLVEPVQGAEDTQKEPEKDALPAKPTSKKPKVDPPANDNEAPANSTAETSTDTCYKGDTAICAAEFQIFELTNKVRAGRGLAPLKFSPNVSFVARGWSSQQANGGFISHDGFPNERQSAYQQEFGRYFDSNAENVAMTGGSSNPAADFVEMWVGSLGHLRNMLGNFQVLGVGVAQAADGSWYATQIFGRE